MTPLQFERWKDFSVRMAKVAYANHRRPSGAWILELVEEFFDEINENDIPCLHDWDHSHAYPEGHPYFQPDVPRGRMRGPYGVGDLFSLFMDSYRPGAPRCKACRSTIWGKYDSDDCRCDEIEEKHGEQWDDQFAGPVHCCIRAGLDLASAPSAGVAGFTCGHIRRMYPEGVPEWVAGDNDDTRAAFAAASDETGIWL